MLEVTEIIQSTFNTLALKMLLLAFLMFTFAIVPLVLLSRINVPGKSQLAGLFSLIGAFIWVKYFIV